MKKAVKKLALSLGFFALAAMGTSPAMADKPAWAGEGKGKHAEKHGKQSKGSKHDRGETSATAAVALNGYFTGDQRDAVRAYYGQQIKSGHCPPGLAKKNNGCLPPGQAKKWAVGRPLGDLSYYGLPTGVLARLGPPPAGHKYVRVAADILLIAVGTGMVVDAIQDLGGI